MFKEKIKKIYIEETTVFGGMLFYLLILLFLIITKNYNNFLILFFSFVLIHFFSISIRLFYFRNRPKKMKYRDIITKLDASSFPSVHSARVTSIALFFLILYDLGLLINSLIILITFSVYYSRFALKKHFISDIIGGIIVGILSSVSFILF
jgi:membrane-associated phospholipid phosphatase